MGYMYKHFSTFAVCFVAVLSFSLLIGRHFDARWAGGEGFIQDFDIVVYGDQDSFLAKRGEIIRSPDTATEKITLSDSTIWLDTSTEVKVISADEYGIEIQVIQGRVVVDGDVLISTRDVKTEINGVASFVHYSWLNKIDVAGIEGEVIVKFDKNELDASETAFSLNTLPPYEYSETVFDPLNSSAAAFYERVLN